MARGKRRRVGFYLLVILAGIVGYALREIQGTGDGAGDGDAYRVVRVVDGDTIIVDMAGEEERVRLKGVDTPETVHPSKPVEYFGKEASAFTKRTLEGRSVRLEFEPGAEDRDRYGRLLAYVFRLPDDLHVNAEIIRQGYGHAYTKYPFNRQDEFVRLEREARAADRGLWAER